MDFLNNRKKYNFSDAIIDRMLEEKRDRKESEAFKNRLEQIFNKYYKKQ
jgi:hypothetical protein